MSSVARRYAKALFELGAEGGGVEAVGRELGQIAGAFTSDDLHRFAENKALDRGTRRSVATRLSETLGISRLLANFVGVLGEQNRLGLLGAIVDEYRRLEDRALGRVRARVRSARPLSEQSRQRIHQVFERKTGKQVVEESVVDPALLGGVIVELQGRVFDGSLRTRLERLQRSLAG